MIIGCITQEENTLSIIISQFETSTLLVNITGNLLLWIELR